MENVMKFLTIKVLILKKLSDKQIHKYLCSSYCFRHKHQIIVVDMCITMYKIGMIFPYYVLTSTK